MTHSPDRSRSNHAFSHFFAALAVAIAFSFFATLAHATETAPAEEVGDYNGSCKDYHKDAFFDVGLGELDLFECTFGDHGHGALLGREGPERV